MEPVGVFSGIASGIDFRELIDQVIALERRPIDRLEARIGETNTKQTAFDQFRSLLDALQNTSTSLSDGTAFDAVLTATTGQSSANTALFSAVGSPGALPGTYQVEVLSLAQAEKLSGNQHADAKTALGIAGEFVLNGRLIAATATDTLTSIRDKINAANAGTTATGVTATILTTGGTSSRLILTADQAGKAGIALSDTSAGALNQLGFVDTTTAIRTPNSSGADSARFGSNTTAVATQLGLSTAVGSQNVTIAGQNVAIDVDTESLTTIATNINALTGVTASVKTNTLPSGTKEYYIDIRGTTSFVDAGNALELLGVLERGRSATTQAMTGATMEVSGGGPATTTTQLADIFQNSLATNSATNDTFTITGTRGDGSSVSLTYTAGAGDQVSDLLAAINDATSGFGAGTRTATATLDANGAVVLTDSVAGDSQLSLSIVAHNEGGGTLDLGTFTASTVGRQRELANGTDAIVKVDGVTLTRSSNTITDAIDDVTLTLLTAEAGKLGTVNVTRSTDEALTTVQTFAEQYNELLAFVKGQLVVSEDEEFPALYGDSALRNTRSSIVNVFLNQVVGAASDLNTMALAGIELNSDGTLSVDTTKFKAAFDSRFNDVQLLFTERGAATDPNVQFVSSTGTASAGTYAVNITTAATQGAVTGSGFSGTYADDATADTITVTDVLSGAVATVSLTNGMTTQNIVDALNTEFTTTYKHKLTESLALYSDPGATTPVTMLTTLDSLHDSGGTPANVAIGDTVSYSGTRVDGTGFTGTYTVIDPTTETMGDLVAKIQTEYGSAASVSIVNGSVVVEAIQGGPTAMALSLTANNEGGGTLALGSMDVTTTGRNTLGITAAASGNEVAITHSSFGSSPGFTVAFVGGGTDNTSQLGITAATYKGVDVVGTLGGFGATGTGQQLVGDAGSPVAGLHVSYTGTTTGAAGDVNLTVGSGAALERIFDNLFEAGSGILDARDKSYDDRISRLNDHIERAETRLARREVFLLKKFTAMEVLLGQLQAQSSSLGSQIQSLLGGGGR